MVVRLTTSEETREPARISLALCFSMISGFLPFFNPVNLIILFLVCIIRINLLAYIAGVVLFSLLAFPLEVLFHKVGFAALTASGLEGFWTSLYNSTFWRFQNFNNSVVMGGMIVSIILFLPLFFVSNRVIHRKTASRSFTTRFSRR